MNYPSDDGNFILEATANTILSREYDGGTHKEFIREEQSKIKRLSPNGETFAWNQSSERLTRDR